MSECKVCGPMFIGICPHKPQPVTIHSPNRVVKPPSGPRVELLTTNEISSTPVVPEPNQKPPSGPPREFWVQAEGFQSSDYLMNVARIPIDLTNQGENRWIFTVIQTVNPYPNPVSNQKKWLHLVERSAYDSVVAELANSKSVAYTRKIEMLRYRDALELVVDQFKDMSDSNDIREHWYQVAKEALNAPGGG